MATRQLPDADLLRKLLRYDPETGKLYWRERPVEMFEGGKYPAERLADFWNRKNAGKEAFTAKTQGYGHGAINGQKFRAHRAIWKMMTGDEPEFIDHINGSRDDNRWCNLRSISKADNAKNARLRSANKSGCPGVSWRPDFERWTVRIKADGKLHLLGSYRRLEDAVRARKAAERRLGFHPNHGRKA